MNNTFRLFIAILIGLIIGSFVNGLIIKYSYVFVPLPIGVDNKTVEGLKKGMHLFQPIHYLMPFLAHALGSFFGSLISTIIVNKNQLFAAMCIAIIFFVGGLMMVKVLPSPLWFTLTDLIGAYIPFALLGLVISKKMKPF